MKKKSVVDKTAVPAGTSVNETALVQYHDGNKYVATVLAFSEDERYLQSLRVSTTGAVMPQKKRNLKKSKVRKPHLTKETKAKIKNRRRQFEEDILGKYPFRATIVQKEDKFGEDPDEAAFQANFEEDQERNSKTQNNKKRRKRCFLEELSDDENSKRDLELSQLLSDYEVPTPKKNKRNASQYVSIPHSTGETVKKQKSNNQQIEEACTHLLRTDRQDRSGSAAVVDSTLKADFEEDQERNSETENNKKQRKRCVLEELSDDENVEKDAEAQYVQDCSYQRRRKRHALQESSDENNEVPTPKTSKHNASQYVPIPLMKPHETAERRNSKNRQLEEDSRRHALSEGKRRTKGDSHENIASDKLRQASLSTITSNEYARSQICGLVASSTASSDKVKYTEKPDSANVSDSHKRFCDSLGKSKRESCNKSSKDGSRFQPDDIDGSNKRLLDVPSDKGPVVGGANLEPILKEILRLLNENKKRIDDHDKLLSKGPSTSSLKPHKERTSSTKNHDASAAYFPTSPQGSIPSSPDKSPRQSHPISPVHSRINKHARTEHHHSVRNIPSADHRKRKSDSRPGEIEIKPGSGVFVDSADLKILRRWKKKPGETVRRLMLCLIGVEELKKMTARGTKEKKGIPKPILDAVKYYVDEYCRPDLDDAEYIRILNLQICNLRNPKPSTKKVTGNPDVEESNDY